MGETCPWTCSIGGPIGGRSSVRGVDDWCSSCGLFKRVPFAQKEDPLIWLSRYFPNGWSQEVSQIKLGKLENL